MGRRLEEQEALRGALDVAVNPSEEPASSRLTPFFGETLENMIDSDFNVYKKIKDDANFGAGRSLTTRLRMSYLRTP